MGLAQSAIKVCIDKRDKRAHSCVVLQTLSMNMREFGIPEILAETLFKRAYFKVEIRINGVWKQIP